MRTFLDRWNMFAVAGAALCTCICGFLVTPPLFQNQTAYHFAVFLVTLLVALWSIPVSLWNTRAHLQAWLWTAVIFFVFSIAGYFLYDHLLSAWTFFYPPQSNLAERAIAGRTLSPDADTLQQQLAAQGRPASAADLVWAAGGDIAAVWPKTAERQPRQDEFEWTYFCLCLVCASAIVSMTQATFCAGQRTDAAAASANIPMEAKSTVNENAVPRT